MLVNNAIKISIIVSQKDRWNYSEFVSLCEAARQPILPLGEWSQKVGMLTAAMFRRPDSPPEEAYRTFVNEINGSSGRTLEVRVHRDSLQAKAIIAAGGSLKVNKNCDGCSGGASL